MSTPDDDLTRDAFLGGRLHLRQPRQGYRAGIDPVLLAAAVEARAGHSVLDLGCGAGTALLCLAARVPGLDLAGIELQPRYAALARRNADENGVPALILESDVGDMPAALKARRFDRVIANPPYFDRRRGTAARIAEREAALGETRELGEWIAAGSRRLAPRGRMTVIQRADRLPDLLAAMAAHLGSLRLRAIQPRPGRAAILVLVEGTKEGRSPARIEPSFVLHGAEGEADGYTAAARAVLRGAGRLA